MAKRKTHKEDRKGWPLFNRILADYIELTRFPELPERPKQGRALSVRTAILITAAYAWAVRTN